MRSQAVTRHLAPALTVALACVLLLPAASDARKGKRKKKGPPPQTAFRLVAVVPPQVEIVRDRILGDVPKMEESEVVERLLDERIVAELTAKGFVVDSSALSEESLADDVELRFALTDLQESYDATLSRILSEPQAERRLAEGRYSLGDSAVAVASMAGVEGLVFVRAQGVSIGGGTKAAIFIFNSWVPRSKVSILLGLVDGRDGQVVDVAGARAAGAILKNPAKVVPPALHRAATELPRAADPPPDPPEPTGGTAPSAPADPSEKPVPMEGEPAPEPEETPPSGSGAEEPPPPAPPPVEPVPADPPPPAPEPEEAEPASPEPAEPSRAG